MPSRGGGLRSSQSEAGRAQYRDCAAGQLLQEGSCGVATDTPWASVGQASSELAWQILPRWYPPWESPSWRQVSTGLLSLTCCVDTFLPSRSNCGAAKSKQCKMSRGSDGWMSGGRLVPRRGPQHAFLPFSFYSPFNRAGMHDTDWGAMGNSSRPAVPTMGKERKHKSHDGGKGHQAASPPAAAALLEAAGRQAGEQLLACRADDGSLARSLLNSGDRTNAAAERQKCQLQENANAVPGHAWK